MYARTLRSRVEARTVLVVPRITSSTRWNPANLQEIKTAYTQELQVKVFEAPLRMALGLRRALGTEYFRTVMICKVVLASRIEIAAVNRRDFLLFYRTL